jgi:glycosyltransferase involved in cell wall biosynthesis
MAVSSPAVTVIMPVLNEESHLEASVQSILDQAYPGELEIILALGPSHDQTNQVAAEIAARVPSLRFIDNPRGLTTVGLNAAIKLAKHDFIVLMLTANWPPVTSPMEFAFCLRLAQTSWAASWMHRARALFKRP